MHRAGAFSEEFLASLGSTVLARKAAESGAVAAGGLDLTLVTTRAGFDALEADWNELFARAGNSTQMFQTFNWCWHWCNHFLPADGTRHPRTRLAVLAGWREGRLVMVWPLVAQRTAGLTQLGWLGEPVSQYGDILVENCADRADLVRRGWEHVTSQLRPDLVRLRKVRADAVIAPLLERLSSVRCEPQEAPCLELSSAPDFAAYEQRYSAKDRKNRRRLLRRLEEQGAVGLETVAPGNAARYAVGIGFTLKRAWLASRGLVSPALADDRLLAFFQDIAEARARPAGCRVSLLTLAGGPAGIQIAIACAGRLALHIIAYDLKHEKAGVGALHIEQTIRSAYDDGFDTLDLLAPKADYKLDWADGSVGVADHAIPLSLAGRAYSRLYLGFARPRLKAAVERAPGWLKTRLGAGRTAG